MRNNFKRVIDFRLESQEFQVSEIESKSLSSNKHGVMIMKIIMTKHIE